MLSALRFIACLSLAAAMESHATAKTARGGRPISVWPQWSQAAVGPATTLDPSPITTGAASGDRAKFVPVTFHPPLGYWELSRPITRRPELIELGIRPAPSPISIVEFGPPSPTGKTLLVDSTTLNLELLVQRLEAYNLSVSAVESRLETQLNWDLQAIEAVVLQFEGIVREREVWAMYWQLLDPEMQHRLGPVRTVTPYLKQLRSRIFEALVTAQTNPNAVSQLAPDVAKAKLRTLGRRVTAWLKDAKG